MIGKGKRVIHKGEYRKEQIKKVIISESVKEIEEEAFAGWTDLREVVFEGDSQLQKIGQRCFANTNI